MVKENVNHYVDTQGVMGEVGQLYTKYDLINYWKENKNSDPSLMEYTSMYDWLKDTLDFMELVNDLQESNMGYSQQLYDMLDDHYLGYNGKILKDYLRDDVYMWLMNDRRLYDEITNTRRKVYSVVYGAMLDLFAYYAKNEIGRNFRLDSSAVQRWFNRHGEDFKEILAPTIEAVEEERKELLVQKESVRRIKESNEERHWLNTELPNYMSLKLKNFLRDNKIKFESSGVGRTLTHFEIFATKDEANMINDFIDSIDIDGPSTPYTEARIGKTKEVKVLQGNWGYGWDDLGEYELTDNKCKDDLKAYRENDPSATYRVIKRRVVNPAYTEDCHGKKRTKKHKFVKEGQEMPYTLWVLDGDDRQWKMYKGIPSIQFVLDNRIKNDNFEEILDQMNTKVYPNGTYYNNYIDWVVIPAGKHPKTFNTNKFYSDIQDGKITESLKYEEGCHGKKRTNKRSTVKESAWVSPDGTKYGKQKRGSGYDYRFSTRELKDMISKGIAKEIKDADKAFKLKDEIIGISWNETNGYTSGVLFKGKDGNLYIGLSGVASAIV